MNPHIALLFGAVLICVALIIETNRTPKVSNATWIPVVWIALLASRPISEWLYPGNTSLYAGLESGSPLDRNVLLILMVMALAILIKRGLPWAKWVQQSPWLIAFLLYCGLSIAWSDFPLVAIKRSIRGWGTVMMILILMSEKDPVSAIAAVFRRCALILLPISVITIKYFRDYGVLYNYWDGREYISGVTTDKNALGRLCFITCILIMWQKIYVHTKTTAFLNLIYNMSDISIILLSIYLLLICDSKTSLVCFAVGIFILFSLMISSIRKKSRILLILLVPVTAAVVILLESTDLPDVLFGILGRDPTLTTRTFLWEYLLTLNTNPVLGVGYESFWLGDRVLNIVRLYDVNAAHNGFLEVYLELGIIGLFLFTGLLLSTVNKAQRTLFTNVALGNLRMTMVFVFIFYNLTESANKLTTFMGLFLILVAIEPPSTRIRRNFPAT